MRSVILADGIGQTLPQKGVQTLLLLGCLGLAWAAVGARDVRVLGRPRYASRALALLGHGGPGAGVRRSPHARDQDRTGASLDGREHYDPRPETPAGAEGKSGHRPGPAPPGGSARGPLHFRAPGPGPGAHPPLSGWDHSRGDVRDLGHDLRLPR